MKEFATVNDWLIEARARLEEVERWLQEQGKHGEIQRAGLGVQAYSQLRTLIARVEGLEMEKLPEQKPERVPMAHIPLDIVYSDYRTMEYRLVIDRTDGSTQTLDLAPILGDVW